MFDLHAKRAVVTGGGRGIGRAIALALARQGATVAVLDLDTEQAAVVAAELGAGALSYGVDVADVAAVADTFTQLLGVWGRIDILVNNAAILSSTPFQTLSEAEWDRVLAINLKSVFATCRAVIEPMAAQGSGRIVNIASVAGKRGGGLLGSAAYSTAKAGVIGLTKALAREFAVHNITVNAICPGPIATAMTAAMPTELRMRALALVPLGRFGSPEDIAAAVVYLASDEAAFVTGEILDIDGGLTMD